MISDPSHKHSGHDVLASGGANACPICQAFEISKLKSEITHLNKALALKLDAMPSGLSAGQSMKFDKLLREAHALLNSHEITFRLPAVPWRDRRDAWNKAFEKVNGGQ